KPGAEVTMEANPGTVEHYRLADYVSAGVNRLSLGAQSFATEKLQALGRIHGREEAIAAIEQALSAGFNSVNVDVMFGLPEQTQQQGLDDLKTLIDLKPQHISWYQLTIEPNTLFHHRPPLLPNDDMLWELQTAGQQLLTNHGYHQYEISAYAQPHHPCQHNLNYWQFGDYLGIGAGAHSKITEQQKGEITRSWKIKHPRAYLTTQGSFVGGQRTLCQEERPVEYFMNALRLYQPIKQQQALIHSGMDQQTFNTALNTLIDKAFVTKDDLHFETTEVGKNFLNDALAALT
ncbi:MAG: radical SAM family heme chaperone HemW, partial [Coxiellaceae bacterium]|nr:radical SAM family heme chaperone HemW [Coxiellaceae bacterium]